MACKQINIKPDIIRDNIFYFIVLFVFYVILFIVTIIYTIIIDVLFHIFRKLLIEQSSESKELNLFN